MADRFQPQEILRVLARHEVRYVLIGGLAATLYGSPHLTQDVDITPDPNLDNLAKLSDALRELDAKVRAVELDEPLPFNHDADSLAAVRVWNLSTKYGDLDISFEPSGTTGHADLAREAVHMVVKDVEVVIAALSDIVRSKQAADRPKDQLTLPTLREILARRMDRTDGG